MTVEKKNKRVEVTVAHRVSLKQDVDRVDFRSDVDAGSDVDLGSDVDIGFDVDLGSNVDLGVRCGSTGAFPVLGA